VDLVLLLPDSGLDLIAELALLRAHRQGHVEFHRHVIFHQIHGLYRDRRVLHRLVVTGEGSHTAARSSVPSTTCFTW